MEFKEIEFRGMTLTEEDLIQLFYYKFTETPLLKRMDAVKDYFICCRKFRTKNESSLMKMYFQCSI